MSGSVPPVPSHGSPSSPIVPPSKLLDVLRIGLGLVWGVNLLFILDPANQFFPTFQATATSFAPTTVTGPSMPELVAAYPLPFAIGIALVTFYLMLAFVTGATTRLACLVGGAFSVVLLITQWGSTFVVPGGTDVGPHPLYFLLYAALYLGGAGRSLTLRAWLSREERAGVPAVASWPTVAGASPTARVASSGLR